MVEGLGPRKGSCRFLLSVALTSAVAASGCRFHKIDTWDEWCAQLEGRTPQQSVVSFDPAAIRRDFVAQFHSSLVAAAAHEYLDGATPSDPTVQELVRLRMVGTWAEGTTLHIANSLLRIDAALSVDEWTATRRYWEHLLAPTTLRASLSAEQGCASGTINAVFDRLVLHGPQGATATIPAQHTLRP
jgi:hypothetical protein